MTTRFIDHILEGDHASRPAFGDVPQGTLYSCSTHSIIYQSDGSTAWSDWWVGTGVDDILDIPTAEMDDTLVLAPDGAGGVEFRAEAGGGGGGGSGRPLHDSTTLDGTYGDDFDGSALDAKWTRGQTTDDMESFDGSASGWMSLDATDAAARLTYHQTGFSPADEFDVVLACTAHIYGGSDITFGPFIVDSSGNGVAAVIRGGFLRLNSVATYADSTNRASITRGGLEWKEHKVWLQIAKRGTVYFARFSFDGETWTRWTLGYVNAMTVDAVGFGRLHADAVTDPFQFRVDRFNVLNYLSRSANRVITPTSGTATYTASSNFSGFPPARAADANLTNDWAANGAGDSPTYWQVAWSVAQDINRVMLLGRADAFGSGYLEFSDGSQYPIGQRVNANEWVPVDLPATKSTTLLKVVSLRGKGSNPGLIEVEAYLAS